MRAVGPFEIPVRMPWASPKARRQRSGGVAVVPRTRRKRMRLSQSVGIRGCSRRLVALPPLYRSTALDSHLLLVAKNDLEKCAPGLDRVENRWKINRGRNGKNRDFPESCDNRPRFYFPHGKVGWAVPGEISKTSTAGGKNVDNPGSASRANAAKWGFQIADCGFQTADWLRRLLPLSCRPSPVLQWTVPAAWNVPFEETSLLAYNSRHMKSAVETETLRTPAVPALADLVGRLERQQGFAEVLASLAQGHSGTLGGVWGSSCALVAASLASHSPGPLVVVCAHGDTLDDFAADLTLFSDRAVEQFPAWESNPRERKLYDEIYGDRMRLLKRLQAQQAIATPAAPQSTDASPPPLIVTSIQSLLQPVPRRETLRQRTRRLRVNEDCDAEKLAAWLLEQGFHSTGAVELPGEFSLRGGILDVYAPDWVDPVRIELFGDTIESLRAFEVSTQRSLQSLNHVEITVLAPSDDDREHFCNYLPTNARFLLIEPGDLEEEGRHYLDRLDRPQEFHSVSTTMREITRFPSVTASGISAGSLETTCHLQIESVERFSGDITKVRDELDSLMGAPESPSTDGQALDDGAAVKTQAKRPARKAVPAVRLTPSADVNDVYIVCQT